MIFSIWWLHGEVKGIVKQLSNGSSAANGLQRRADFN